MKMNKGLMKKIAATGMAISMMAATGAVAFADDTQDAAAQDTPKAAVEQEMDYGTLSADEIAQLNAIYDRFGAIMDEIFANIDESAFENMTEAQLDALHAPYEDELAELDQVWGIDAQEIETRVTDETVRRIRRKLTAAGSTVRITGVWGYGYRLEDEAKD